MMLTAAEDGQAAVVLSQLAGVGDRGADVVGIEAGVVIDDLRRRETLHQSVEYNGDVNARAADIRTSGANLWIDSHPSQQLFMSHIVTPSLELMVACRFPDKGNDTTPARFSPTIIWNRLAKIVRRLNDSVGND